MAVVVVGPPGAGKSTAATSIARALGRDVVHFDTVRARAYRPYGYTPARADRLFREGGAGGLHRYEARFEARALARGAVAHAGSVLDTGGGVLQQYTDADTLRVHQALTAAEFTVLVLPFAEDLQRSADCLTDRVRARGAEDPFTDEWLDGGGRQLLHALVLAAHAHLPLADLVLDTARPVPAATGTGRRPGSPLADRITNALGAP
ncbi:AAA family ATPase [Streptomyces xanthophaeus]